MCWIYTILIIYFFTLKTLIMKKNLHFLGLALCGLLLTSLFPNNTSAQIVSLFYETMGSGAIGNPVITSWAGFDNNSNPNIVYGGSGDIRTTSASTYPGASGGNNVYLSNGKNFTISGISLAGYDSLIIEFGLYKSTLTEDGSNIAITATIDGVGTPISVSLPTNTGSSKWYEITTTESFPVGSILNLSFSNIGTSGSAFRIDDIYITGISVSPTPIRLAQFKASRTNNQTKIEWKTAMEFNHAYFDLERGTDGKSFESIAKINSENNPTGANYEFTDISSFKGTCYYRLKSVDIDGKYEYSWIISITDNQIIPEDAGIYLKRNVVKDNLSLVMTAPKNKALTYVIYGMNGKQIIQNTIQFNQDSKFSINVSSLTSGMYFLKTISGNEIQSFKFIKE